jgi:hypothetical protein
MTKVLIFILSIPLALAMMIYREKIIRFTGKFEWAEHKIGPGGSYTMIIIVALIIWIGSMMYALGSFDQLFGFLSAFF